MHDEHWTELEIQQLTKAQSFEDAADIAVRILKRMSEKGKDIVQICGPMSTGGLGSLALNMERFERAVEKAYAHDELVFNQVPFQATIIRLINFREGDDYCMDILEVFYRKVFESGYIRKLLFLPDWQSSVGTTWERNVAIEFGMIVEEYPAEWLD